MASLITATISTIVKSCKIQKVAYFTQFNKKNTHINGCKIVHKCISATVAMHICTFTVAILYIILVLFLSSHILSSTYSLFSTHKNIIYIKYSV